MFEPKTHKVPKSVKKRALIDNETYLDWYQQSIKNPEKFWAHYTSELWRSRGELECLKKNRHGGSCK